MGVGGSKSPAVGLPANPRVIHAENKSRQEKAVSDTEPTGTRNAILAEPARTAVHDNVGIDVPTI